MRHAREMTYIPMHAQDMEVGHDGQEGFPCPSSFCEAGAALSPNLENQGIGEFPP